MPIAMPSTRALPTSTRAIVLDRDAKGQYSWRLGKAPVPALGEHDVLLQVRAVSLQSADLESLKIINDPADSSGLDLGCQDRTGQIVGVDAAGEVAAVGRLVESVKPGDRVVSLYYPDYLDGPITKKTQESGRYYLNGVFADYVVIPETGVAPIPSGLNYDEATTLGTAGLTAWMATVGATGGSLVRHQDIVVIEGTGSISTFALQFVLGHGAHAIVTSSSDEKLENARKLGAWHGINYKKTPNWSDRVLEITGGKGANLVIDMGGKSSLEQAIASVAYYGTVAVVGVAEGREGAIPAVPLLRKVARAQGVYTGSRADYLRMSTFITAHAIQPIVVRTYPFAQYSRAVQELKAGTVAGRLVLRLQ